MTPRFTIPSKKWQGFKGYTSDATNCPADHLAPPSVNCIIDASGKATQRLGFQTEADIDLGESGKSSTSFYLEQYDVTVFALGTKVKYFDWNTSAVYDTGLTLTDGTVSRLDAYAGDVYLTNTTDGINRLAFGRLNDAAANSGDANVAVDTDLAVRMKNFGTTNRVLRIQGTAEAYTDETSVTLATGVVTLTGTLSQSYSDNAVCVVTQSLSSLEKLSKLFFWKERMGGVGSQVATNADQPNATVYFGKFAAPDAIENVIDFTFGSGGSTREIVGKWGRVTNAVPAKDYLYVFKEAESYSASAAEVGIASPSSSSPGPSLGATPMNLKDEIHGCLNEDSACVIGNNEITYITSDRRIMRIRLATDSGAAILFPDEGFDVPLREHLKNMDTDQTGARAFYHKAKRRSVYQVRITGQWYWFVYDHNIDAWQPPQQVLFASDFFERKGVLYCTDGSDDTVYSLNTAFDDDGVPVNWACFTGNFNVGSADMKKARVQGEVSQAAMVQLQTFVTNRSGGRQGGSQKTIDGSTFTYSDDHAVGADAVGEGGVEAETAQIADWEAEWDIFPSEANRVQLGATNENGGYCSISQFHLVGSQKAASFSQSL